MAREADLGNLNEAIEQALGRLDRPMATIDRNKLMDEFNADRREAARDAGRTTAVHHLDSPGQGNKNAINVAQAVPILVRMINSGEYNLEAGQTGRQRLPQKLRAEIQQLTVQRDQYMMQNHQIRVDNVDLNRQVEQLQNQMENVRIERNNALDQVRQLIENNDFQAANNANLVNDNARLINELNQLTLTNRNLNTDKIALTNTNNRLVTANTTLEAQVANLNVDLDRLRLELQKKEMEVAQLRDQLAVQLFPDDEEEEEKIENQVAVLEEEKAGLTRQLNESKEREEKLAEQNQKLSLRLGDVEREMTELKNRSKEAAVEGVEAITETLDNVNIDNVQAEQDVEKKNDSVKKEG